MLVHFITAGNNSSDIQLGLPGKWKTTIWDTLSVSVGSDFRIGALTMLTIRVSHQPLKEKEWQFKIRYSPEPGEPCALTLLQKKA